MAVRKADILIVDDDADFRQMLAEGLESEHRACATADGGQQACELICRKHFDAIITDIAMPGVTGLDLLDKIVSIQPQCRVIVMTGRSSTEWAKQAIRRGAFDFVEKPFGVEGMGAMVDEALRSGSLPGRAPGKFGSSVGTAVAHRDALTGLVNHRRFFEKLVALRPVCRQTRRPLTVAMIDLDHFGRLNGRHGHAMGDLVLWEVAGKLRNVIRSTDVLARFGGEEFAVAMPESTADHGRAMADRVHELLADELVVTPDASAHLTVSIGIAESQAGFVETERELVDRAIEAMKAAKRGGRDRTVIWDEVDRACDDEAVEVDTSSLVEMKTEFSQINHRLKQAYLESTRVLVAAVEAKEPHTERHSMVVALYAEELGRLLNLSDKEIAHITTAAMLHDIGKIGIPDHILSKPGKLTDAEFAVVRRHPVMAVQILEHASFLRGELQIIRHHHERWDGGGYPDGLAGEQIPFGARILHVADAMDAMFSVRSYKQGYTRERVVAELRRCEGTQFDPKVVAAALAWLDRYPDRIVTPDDVREPVTTA